MGAGYSGNGRQKGKRGGLTWVGAGGNLWGSWRLTRGPGTGVWAPRIHGGGAGWKGQGHEHWMWGAGRWECAAASHLLELTKLFLLREWHVGSESAPCPPEDKPEICLVVTGPPPHFLSSSFSTPIALTPDSDDLREPRPWFILVGGGRGAEEAGWWH